MTQSPVEVYFSRSNTPEGVVPGFTLMFESREAADEGFALATEAATEGRLPPVYVTLSRQMAKSWTFELVTMGPTRTLAVDAAGVPSAAVSRFLHSFESVLYYFVIFGYKDGGGIELLDPAENALYKSELTVDGALVRGSNRIKPKWSSVFDVANMLEIGDFQ